MTGICPDSGAGIRVAATTVATGAIGWDACVAEVGPDTGAEVAEDAAGDGEMSASMTVGMPPAWPAGGGDSAGMPVATGSGGFDEPGAAVNVGIVISVGAAVAGAASVAVGRVVEMEVGEGPGDAASATRISPP